MFRRTRSSEARSLGETHRQLDIALGAMTQGLCLYDQANKLQLWNNRFAELYNVKDALRRGMTFEEVICLTVSLGLYGERSVADVLEMRKAFIARRERARMDQVLSNGTIIEIVHVPLEDGGWVATYEEVTARRAADERLRYLATHDEMTGLANRSKFLSAAVALQSTSDLSSRFAILLLDLDGFKRVNDTHGHPVGDALLIEVGRRLESMDTNAEVIARLGGDEFAILRSSVPDDDVLRPWASAIVNELCIPYAVGKHVLVIGASAGLAAARPYQRDVKMVLAQADSALYVAKSSGGARVVFA